MTGGIAFSTATHAAGFTVANENGDAVIAADKTVDSSAYVAGNNVIVEGTVKGDLYCAGKTITIKGTVEGDVLCAGMDLTIGGTVTGDIRAVGSDITMNGNVAGSATLAGQKLTIAKDATVGRDATLGGETLSIEGAIGRDVMVGSSTFSLGGMIGRDATAGVTSLTVTGGAQIIGNLSYTSQTKGTISESAVKGQVNYTEATGRESDKGFDVLGALLGVFAVIIFTVLAVLLMPRFIHTAASLSLRDVLLASLLGLAFVVLVPVLATTLFFTGVGTLAGVALLVVYALGGLFSTVFSSYYVGQLVMQKRAKNAVLVGALGALLLGIALAIPILGILVFIVMVLVGIGMPLMHLRYQFTKHPYTIV